MEVDHEKNLILGLSLKDLDNFQRKQFPVFPENIFIQGLQTVILKYFNHFIPCPKYSEYGMRSPERDWTLFRIIDLLDYKIQCFFYWITK